MKTLVRASACGTCLGVHGDAPAYWPTCPDHGHWLKEREATADGYVYGCLAPKCTHTQTLTGRITMTTEQAATAALAIRDGQGYWDERQLAALQQLGIKDVTRADLQVFMHYCQRTGLDPFSRQIYMIARRTKENGEWVSKQTIQVGIDGLRVIAQRAAKRDGVTLSYGPTKWYDHDGSEYPVWVAPGPPAAASVTIYRDGKPFPGVARFASFAAFSREGQLQGQWAVMGDHLIAKCAEAQALRRAFPHDLEGIQVADEAITHSAHQEQPTYSDVALPAVRGPRQQATGNRAGMGEDIRKEFDRIGLEDVEERAVYVIKLANKEPGFPLAELTDGELRFALDSLKDCEDLAALIDLCAAEAS